MRMKRQILLLIAIGAVISFWGCAFPELKSSPPAAKILNQRELEQLFQIERSAEILSAGTKVSVMYFPDGRQEIDWGGGSDKGTFRIKENEFCSTWTWLRKGAESCFNIYKVNENEFEFRSSDGSSHATMHLK
jgi:hypothetical protein